MCEWYVDGQTGQRQQVQVIGQGKLEETDAAAAATGWSSDVFVFKKRIDFWTD